MARTGDQGPEGGATIVVTVTDPRGAAMPGANGQFECLPADVSQSRAFPIREQIKFGVYARAFNVGNACWFDQGQGAGVNTSVNFPSFERITIQGTSPVMFRSPLRSPSENPALPGSPGSQGSRDSPVSFIGDPE